METQQFLDKFAKDTEKMKAQAGAVVTGFAGLFAKTMADGTVSARVKELIALGIAVAVQCVPCIRLHVQKCLSVGATPEQVVEAAGVAVMMCGGPAYTHLPVVLDALEALNK